MLWVAPAAHSAEPQYVPGSCDIHVWQRGIYGTESHAPYINGLVGAIVNSEYQRKYPAATVSGVMEDVLNIDALPDTLRPISWAEYTGTASNNVIFERGSIDEVAFKALKLSRARNSRSQSDCYIELYIGKQTFSGGSLKSHLFGDFYARTFYAGAYSAKTASLWDQTRKLSVADEAALNAAREIIRTGFVNALKKFLGNKLPKRQSGI